MRIARPTFNGCPAFKEKWEIALQITIRGVFDHEVSTGLDISHLQVNKHTLTVVTRSQSKLSQQELADLQKATHFDKKELQQWYKGQ